MQKTHSASGHDVDGERAKASRVRFPLFLLKFRDFSLFKRSIFSFQRRLGGVRETFQQIENRAGPSLVQLFLF
jgi:hypothetical protein